MRGRTKSFLMVLLLAFSGTQFLGCNSEKASSGFDDEKESSSYSLNSEKDEEKDKDESEEQRNETSKLSSTSSAVISSYIPNDGRVLASGCFQCHGTNGISVNSLDSIAGEDELAHEMFGEDPIMDAQAKGFTASEISMMESYLKTLPENSND